jgi:hypothetical protein
MIVLHAGFRHCTGCWRILPKANFNAKTRGPDGEPRTFQSRCRPCARRRQRQLTGAKPKPAPLTAEELRERQAKQRVAYVEAIRADPAKLAAWRATRRMDAKLARDRKRGGPPRRKYPQRRMLAKRRVSLAWAGPSRAETVPAAPLRAYIGRRFPGFEAGEVAVAVGEAVSYKGLHRLLTDRVDRIELDFVDRFLTRGLGRPDLLDALYPYEAVA